MRCFVCRFLGICDSLSGFVFWFLVEKKTISACFCIHTAAVSAWSHAGGVERNARATPVQTLENNATTKQKLVLKQTCGTL